MLYLRAALVTTFVLTVGLVAYIYVSFGDDFRFDQVTESYLKRDYTAANELLNAIAVTHGEQQVALQRAIIAREQADLPASDRLLATAADSGDVWLNRALNAYLSGNSEKSIAAVAQAQEWLTAKNPYVRALRAANQAAAQHYRKAFDLLDGVNLGESGNPWLDAGFTRALGPQWVALQTARCRIGEGDYLAARRTLEAISQAEGGTEQLDAWFLTGLSYVQEAESRPVDARLSYYKLALEFFERLPPRQVRFRSERAWVTDKLVETITALLDRHELNDVGGLAATLGYWKEESALQLIVGNVLQRFHNALAAHQWEAAESYARTATRLPSGDSIGEKIQQRLMVSIEQQLEAGNSELSGHYWRVLTTIVADPAIVANRLASETEASILKWVDEDSAELSRIKPYIAFWELIERDGVERLAFSNRLVSLAGALWIKDDQGQKPLALMKLANSLPNLAERKAFKEYLEKALRIVYHTALQRNEAAKLGCLIEAINYFEVPGIDLQDAIETANQIEDVKYLYTSGRLAEASRRLSLLSVVAPDNIEVLRLSGLVALRCGQHDKALVPLRRIANPDEEVRCALGVAELLAGDVTTGTRTLDQLIGNRFFTSDLSTEVGFALLVNRQWQTAARWFRLVGTDNPDVCAGLAYAAAQEGNIEEALEHLRHLKDPYNRLIGLQLLAVQQMAARGELKAAEQTLDSVLAKREQPPTTVFPVTFRKFKEAFLDTIDPYWIAGEFYRVNLNDSARALQAYSKAAKGNDALPIARIKVELDLNLADRALDDLAALPVTVPNTVRALLSARAYCMLEDPIPAIAAYEEALRAGVHLSEADRRSFISLLVKEGKWEMASTQLTQLSQRLPHEELVLLECQAHLGKLQAIPPELPLAAKLRLATYAPNCSVKFDVQDNLTASEAEEALAYALSRKDYATAEALAEKYSNAIESSTVGLLHLAQLRTEIHQDERAEVLLRRALVLAADNPQVTEAIVRYATNRAFVEQELQRVTARSAQHPRHQLFVQQRERLNAKLRSLAEIAEAK